MSAGKDRPATAGRSCILTACFLLTLPVARAWSARGTDPGASALPASLAPAWQAFLDAPQGEARDRACEKLIDAYVPLVRQGADVPTVDHAIAGALSVEDRSLLVANLAIDGIFSPLQDACMAKDQAAPPGTFTSAEAGSARSLMAGLRTLAEARPQLPAAWATVAAELRDGWRYFPSDRYGDVLDAAFRAAGDRRGAFEFKAYRYFDESAPNPFRWLGLAWRWLLLPDRRPFAAEIAAVKQSIKADILRTSPAANALPRFGAESFFTSSGEPRPLSFGAPASLLAGKPALFAFFQTTCSYCVDELTALGRLYPKYQKGGRGDLAFVGLKLPTNLPPVIAGLAPFEKRLHLPFPLLENDASGIGKAYGVRTVPLLLFLDERGVVEWTVALRGQGRLEEKLSWFIDDLLADGSRAGIAGGKGSLAIDLYADPDAAAGTMISETQRRDLERATGVRLDVAVHDATRPAVARALQDRLLALRATFQGLPVGIMGGRAIQGAAAITRELGVIARMASAQ